MRWLYRVQQRLALTQREASVLLVLLLLFLAGLLARAWQQCQGPPTAHYAEAERLLAAGAAHAAEMAAAAEAPPIVALNTATAADLERLPRIGPSLARRILDYRAAHGPFRRVDDLLHVSGIGEKTLAQLTPFLVLDADSAETP